MAETLRLALDAMGGDRAPEIVVRGADLALERMPDLRFDLVGDEARIAPLVAKTRRLKTTEPAIIHTTEVVPADEKPSTALRTRKQSSMRLAIDRVASGDANGVVSAGNTGALMAMSKLSLRMCPGIKRPAIASFFPTRRGETCMLDLGANLDCDAETLVQFALMGQVFARIVLGLERPTVGLLNVGSEEQKGHEFIREAATTLRDTDLPFEFVGFVEGDDIAGGTVDVVVCDGFTGNVALKTAEGTSRMIAQFLRESFRTSWLSRLGYLLARSSIDQLRKRLDPRRYNGAMFLGLNGVSVKSHGGTDAIGFANAIGVAADLVRHGFVKEVSAELETLSSGTSVDDLNTEALAT